MSRIGNKPIVIPEGIEVKIQDSEIIVKGQKGELLTRIVDGAIKLKDRIFFTYRTFNMVSYFVLLIAPLFFEQEVFW